MLSIHQQEEQVLLAAEKHAEDLVDSYFDVLNTMMMTGTIGNRDIITEKIKKKPEVIGIRAIRSNELNEQFPTNRKTEEPKDLLDFQALRGHTVKQLNKTSDGRVFTFIKPAIATDTPNGVTSACTGCHAVPNDTVLGAMRIDYSLKAQDMAIRKKISFTLLVNLLLFGMGILWIALTVSKSIVKPIKNIQGTMEQVSEGDLTQGFQNDNQDEVGDIGRNLGSFVSQLRSDMGRIQENAISVSQASDSLNGVSGDLANGAEMVTGKSEDVAVKIGELTTNIESMAQSAKGITEKIVNVSHAAEQVNGFMVAADVSVKKSANEVLALATASEEMTTTISEISHNADKTREITASAVHAVKESSSQVEALHRASSEIDSVVGSISAIAKLTSTLALNASIEAASAGEAGKGFAVVANEVNDLAKQTAHATAEIREQIQNIQDTSKLTIKNIQAIFDVINQVSDMVTNIASAVEQQSVTTQENARNISNASEGMSDVLANVGKAHEEISQIASFISSVVIEAENVSRNASNSVGGAQTISGNAKQMNGAAAESSDHARRVEKAAQELANLATQLHGFTKQFKV